MNETPERPLVRRTFWLGVLNGGLYMGTMRLTDPGGLLSLLVLRLTGSAQMIGLMSCLAYVGWFWPALLVAGFISHMPRKLGVYKGFAGLRIALTWASAALLFTSLPERVPLFTFWALAWLAFLLSSGGGVSYVPFMDIVGKSVPSTHRGLFISLRHLLGGILGLGTAALAGYILSPLSGLSFPVTFGVILAIAALLQTLGMLVFFLVDEPEGVVERRRRPFWEFLRHGLRLVRRDPSFRNFIVLRLVNALAMMSAPFAVAFAKQEIGTADSTVGYLLAVNVGAALLANLAWGRLSDTRGNRAVLRAYAVLAAAPPIVALMAAASPSREVVLPFIESTDIRVVLVGVVFFLSGLTVPAKHLAEANYILDLAPEQRRSTYVGLSHTLSAPQTAVPMLAGWIVVAHSYNALFATTLVCAGLAVLMSAKGLREPRAA